jgi:hypothetical protein
MFEVPAGCVAPTVFFYRCSVRDWNVSRHFSYDNGKSFKIILAMQSLKTIYDSKMLMRKYCEIFCLNAVLGYSLPFEHDYVRILFVEIFFRQI